MKTIKLYLIVVHLFFLSVFSLIKAQEIIFEWDGPDVETSESFPCTTCESKDGLYINPHGTHFSLNIFINIIYDQTPDLNPKPGTVNNWPYYTTESVNQGAPSYLANFMDREFTGEANLTGTFTKYFYDASFGHFIYLGDFMVVNIKQSTIESFLGIAAGATFNDNQLLIATLHYINNNGGLNTIYNHNSLSDYDINNDIRIDYTNILIRNATKMHGEHSGGGHSFTSNLQLKINSNFYSLMYCTDQGPVGELALDPISNTALAHEIGHKLFGNMPAHNSDLGSYNGVCQAFIAPQGAYSIMSQKCVNGYERWRMNWLSSIYNTNNYDIAANNISSDITKSMGNQTFTLRDFLTTGDAIRIKLPYKDPNAYEQYIWIENHQVSTNGKWDLPQWKSYSCRQASNGIYMYYQIGWDQLSGSSTEVYHPFSHFIKQISAEGNFEWVKSTTLSSPQCVNYEQMPTQIQVRENPFCGAHDMEYHYDNNSSDIRLNTNNQRVWIKQTMNNTITKNLSFAGDNLDAFTGDRKISIATNPATVNLVNDFCYFTDKSTKVLVPVSGLSSKNSNTIYLSGLSIRTVDQGNGTFVVYVEWDDYDVSNDTRWTGNMVLKENVNLTTNKTITIDQNKNPIQLTKIGNYYSPKSKLVCESGSQLVLQPGSTVILDEGSELIFKSGSYLELNSAQIILNNGSNLTFEDGSQLNVYGTSDVVSNSNSTFCIEQGAIINGTPVSEDPIQICGNYSNITTQLISLDNINVCTTGSIIYNTASVKLRAPSIGLTTGFKANSGSYFKAKAFSVCEASNIFKNAKESEESKESIVENEVPNFEMFPNPSKGLITLRFFGVDDVNFTSVIEFYDSQGRMVEKRALSYIESDLELNLTTGIYFARVIIQDRSIIKKLIIQ